MKADGACSAGGPLNGGSKPTRTNPEPTRPVPSKAKPARTPGGRVPDHIRAAIVREWVEGDSAQAIADRHGARRQTVYSICKETAR